MPDAPDLHAAMFARRVVLPSDWTDYGGTVERWVNGTGADCSCGCIHARWLAGALGGDWCICARPGGPRFGLLTFEHQAGHGCFEAKRRKRDG
jgi:hypothetical protein